jgi:FkbM family methyltransferase
MQIQYWTEAFKAIGIAPGIRYALIRKLMRHGLFKSPRFQVRPTRLAAPIVLRSAPSSDAQVFDQIFIEREYQSIEQISTPRLILDLGANIGLSSLYFAREFPQAEIIAVEPDPGNFAMLQKNVAAYPRITPLLGAIWHSSRQLQLAPGTYKDRKEWATQVVEGSDGGVQAFDIPSLVGDRVIDLLKIDIERSEIELFSKNTGWLRQVRNLCIELHDQECIDVFFKALEPFKYDLSHSGELTICRSIEDLDLGNKERPASQLSRT